jgi:hypothetical protein
MSVSAKVGVPVPLGLVLEDGNEAQFPRAHVFQAGGTSPIAVLNLPHKSLGHYEALYTPDAVGILSSVYVVYSDQVYAVENVTYTRQIEQIFVTETAVDDVASSLARVLGLVHENAFIDNTVFDQHGELLAARVRVFSSKTAVEAATNGGVESTGLIAVYEMSTVYEAKGRMGSYRMKRVQ